MCASTLVSSDCSCSCEELTFCLSTLNSHRYCHMHSPLNVLLVSNAFAAYLWVYLLLLAPASFSVILADPLQSFVISASAFAHSKRSPITHHGVRTGAFSDEASVLTYRHGIRISASDLQSLPALERTIQLAAFQQFDSRRTGQLYTVSAPALPMGSVRAIRLRSGSFRRYGVSIEEFIIPQGCVVHPIPERILLVYTRFVDTSLFEAVPEGFVLASPVVSVLVYDAGNLTSNDVPRQLSVSSTESPISIRLPQGLDAKCAEFVKNSTFVNVTEPIQGVCQADHLGAFALVTQGIVPAPSPSGQQSPASQHKHSNTWKIVVGSVIGGSALLALLSLAALWIGKRRRESKLSRMEYQAEQGETLQMARVRNSRVPSASNTRTQPTLVNDYSL